MFSKLGGSALNTASILARAGAPTRFVSEVGQDFLGDWAIARIAERNIETRFVQQLPGVSTPLSLTQVDTQGKAQFSFYWAFGDTQFQPNSAVMARAKRFHFGSISAFEPRPSRGIESLLEIAREHTVLVSFDPNLYLKPDEAHLEQLRRYMPYVSVLKASLDAARLLFPSSADDPQSLLEHLVELGAPVTVLTLGPPEPWPLSAAGWCGFRGVKVTVVDTMGAGNAFTAGLI